MICKVLVGEPQLIPSSWAYKEHIPYVRAVRYVPRAMKDRLPATYLVALDTQVIDQVWGSILELS